MPMPTSSQANSGLRNQQLRQSSSTLLRYLAMAIARSGRAVIGEWLAMHVGCAPRDAPVDVMQQLIRQLRISDGDERAKFAAKLSAGDDVAGQLLECVRRGGPNCALGDSGVVDLRFEPSWLHKPTVQCVDDARVHLAKAATSLLPGLKRVSKLGDRVLESLCAVLREQPIELALLLHGLALSDDVGFVGSLPAQVLTHERRSARSRVGDIDLTFKTAATANVRSERREAFASHFQKFCDELYKAEATSDDFKFQMSIVDIETCRQIKILLKAGDGEHLVAKVELSDAIDAVPLARILNIQMHVQRDSDTLVWRPRVNFVDCGKAKTRALIESDLRALRCTFSPRAVNRGTVDRANEALLVRAASMARRGFAVFTNNSLSSDSAVDRPLEFLHPAVRLQVTKGEDGTVRSCRLIAAAGTLRNAKAIKFLRRAPRAGQEPTGTGQNREPAA
jgi:hypothetical protein